MITYFENHPNIDDIKTLQAIYKQVIDVAEVSFEGEPLSGLQIMGVLESRVLDFETVIITSVNEGKFPPEKAPIRSFLMMLKENTVCQPTRRKTPFIHTISIICCNAPKTSICCTTPIAKDLTPVKKAALLRNWKSKNNRITT